MNKLIAILLLSTVTCFGGSKFVNGKFVSGAIPFLPPPPDLLINGTNLILAANATYIYSTITMTNGGSITIADTNVIGWTVIICNNIKTYGTTGRTINTGYVTVWEQNSPVVNKTAADGTSLSSTYQPHVIGPEGFAGGQGGNGGDTDFEFGGGNGGNGISEYSSEVVYGGIGGSAFTAIPYGLDGNDYTGTATETCPDSFFGSSGGGGAAGLSRNFLYLSVKQSVTGVCVVLSGGQEGAYGGNAGSLFNYGLVQDLVMGYGGSGGTGGNGGVVVLRKPALSTYPTVGSIVGGAAGTGGNGPTDVIYNAICGGFFGGSNGLDGYAGNDGSVTILTSL